MIKLLVLLFLVPVLGYGQTIRQNQVRNLSDTMGVKADTNKIIQSFDFVIEKSGSTIYSRPAYKSGYKAFSGTLFNDVLSNAMNQLVNGGSILIKGSYDNVKPNIDIPFDNIHIYGEGKYKNYLKLQDKADTITTLGTLKGMIIIADVNGFELHDITLDGNGTNMQYKNSGSGSEGGANSAKLSGIYIGYWKNGLSTWPSTTETVIDNCYIHSFTIFGIRNSENAQRTQIRNCELYDNYWNGMTIHGYYTYIDNCYISGSSDVQLSIYGVNTSVTNTTAGSSLGNNKGSQNTQRGISIEHNAGDSLTPYANHNTFLNVTVDGGADSSLVKGVTLQDANFCVFDNLKIYRVTNDAFTINGGTGNILRNSYIEVAQPWKFPVVIDTSLLFGTGATSNYIYNNVLYGTPYNSYAVFVRPTCTKNVIENNKVYGKIYLDSSPLTYLSGNLSLYDSTWSESTIKLNGVTYKPNANGLVDLGTISGGGGGISRTDLSATAPLTYNNTTGVFGITKATSSVDGYLSAADWVSFNGKMDKLNVSYRVIATFGQTLALSDAGKLFADSTTTATGTYTVPTNASVAFPVGTQISFTQMGNFQTAVSPNSGVTIVSADGALKTLKKGSVMTLIKVSTDTWLLTGSITN